MESLRKNTAKIQFQKTDAKPTDLEMMRFVLNNGLTTMDIHTLYQDLYERCIYIKFNVEQKYLEFITEKSVLKFEYTSGSNTDVTVKAASGVMRYVRVFNLPPEITDKTLSESMHRFGNILSTRREKFSANSLLPVFSGVRGIYMEVEKEIPQFIYVENIKARIFYDGMKERCFKCGEESHKKQECPLLYNANKEISQQQLQQQAKQSQQGPLQPQVPLQPQEQQVQQQTQSENKQHKCTVEQNTVTLSTTHERPKYSEIAKITQQHEEAQNKIEKIKTMINLRDYTKERKQETDSSCMDTESEEVPVNGNKRGRPAKKSRISTTKNREKFMEKHNITTLSRQTTKNNDFISPLPPIKLNNETG